MLAYGPCCNGSHRLVSIPNHAGFQMDSGGRRCIPHGRFAVALTAPTDASLVCTALGLSARTGAVCANRARICTMGRGHCFR
eukprot:scaffold1317_cov348-Prasinococcus_capsulatus_cf.AAC.3